MTENGFLVKKRFQKRNRRSNITGFIGQITADLSVILNRIERSN
jgi:hypothetical protein